MRFRTTGLAAFASSKRNATRRTCSRRSDVCRLTWAGASSVFAARPLFRALTATRTLLPAPRPLSPFAVDLPAIVAAPLSSPGTALLPPRFPCPVQLLELFLCEWPVQLLVQRLERLRPGGSARAARHEKAKRPVERRQLGLAQGARELFWESQARDAAEAGARVREARRETPPRIRPFARDRNQSNPRAAAARAATACSPRRTRAPRRRTARIASRDRSGSAFPRSSHAGCRACRRSI